MTLMIENAPHLIRCALMMIESALPRIASERLILSDFNIEAYSMTQIAEESESENESADDDNTDENDSSDEDESEEGGNVHAEVV